MAHTLQTAISEAKRLVAMLESIEQIPQASAIVGARFTLAEISAALERYNHQLRNLAQFLSTPTSH